MCLECEGCLNLQHRVDDLDASMARRASQDRETLQGLQMTIQRLQEELRAKSDRLDNAEEELKLHAERAHRERAVWEDEQAEWMATAMKAKEELEKQVPVLLEAVAVQEKRTASVEGNFTALRADYRVLGDMSIEALKAVELGRKEVAELSPWLREEGAAVRVTAQKLGVIEATLRDHTDKIQRAEAQVAIAESAPVPVFDEKMRKIEDLVKEVQEEERTLGKTVTENTQRLDKLKKTCDGVQKWMMSLAKPVAMDVPGDD